MEKIIQAGIVGFGFSGYAFHAPFLNLHKGFNIQKVLERKSERSKSIYPSVEVVKDFKSILNDDNINLVIICTPNIYHYSMVKDWLNTGKHVVVEKPFMNSSKEAEQLIALAKQKGLSIFVYQNRRWDGDFLTIKKIFKSDVLGFIEYYEAHFDRYSPGSVSMRPSKLRSS